MKNIVVIYMYIFYYKVYVYMCTSCLNDVCGGSAPAAGQGSAGLAGPLAEGLGEWGGGAATGRPRDGRGGGPVRAPVYMYTYI